MPTEVTVDAPRVPLPPVDPNVKIPDSVKRAAAHAESFYQQPAPVAPVSPSAPVVGTVDASGAPAAPPAPVAPQLPAPPQPEVPPVVTPPAPDGAFNIGDRPPGDPASWNEWQQRYNAMKGRHDQAVGIMGQMQEQMTQLGNELLETQREVQRLRTQGPLPAPTGQPQPPANRKLLTPEDEEHYGAQFLDVTRRAALEAVGPELETLRTENQNLRRQLHHTQGQTVAQRLDADLPGWRTINTSDMFKAWLRLPDVKSGLIRGEMLQNAFRAASAPRVKAFFDEFLAEQGQSRSQPPPPVQEPLPAPPTARQPALSLDSLVAPGRAIQPAPGGTQTPADKPTFTRAEIAGFYADVRRGVYAGRDQEKAVLETAIFAAQREGRVR